MRLYHTGASEIRKPDLGIGRRNADFGQGFYLCDDESFAGNWARERTSSDIYVNIYELETDGLNIVRLERDIAWFEYIFANRRGRADAYADADVIIGPIAGDTLFETYGIITSGLLTPEQALELLMIGPAYTQVVIRTEKAASQLEWTGSYVISDEAISAAKESYKEASERYEEEFAEVLDSFDASEGDGH